VKLTGAAIVVLVGAAAAAYALGLVGSEDVPASLRHLDLGAVELPGEGILDEDLGDTACERLALVAAGLGADSDDPNRLLRGLGRRAAGIHNPPRAFVDLARGGQNVLPGAGFRNRYNDHTAGQARHFAGVATATTYGGDEATRLISVFARDDSPESADGRLTDAAIEFSRLLRGGKLETADAGDWILAEICRPPLAAGPPG
jgi:hypothetical protein